MRAMRVCKAICAGLGGGMLLQAGGCDTGTLTAELVSSIAPIVLDALLNAILGGTGLGGTAL